MSATDDEYLQTVLDVIRVYARCKPKFRQGVEKKGLTLEQFWDFIGEMPSIAGLAWTTQ